MKLQNIQKKKNNQFEKIRQQIPGISCTVIPRVHNTKQKYEFILIYYLHKTIHN